MTIDVCVAGATGWTGRPVAEAVIAADDLVLRSAVSRASAGKDLGTAWGGDPLGVPVHASVADALDGVDVLVDYTSDEAVRANTFAALQRGVSVVIGTSGPLPRLRMSVGRCWPSARWCDASASPAGSTRSCLRSDCRP